MKDLSLRIGLPIILLILLMSMMGCKRHMPATTSNILDQAEGLMEECPDSSYYLLCGVDTTSLVSPKDKARYALLLSKAMDRTYRDVYDFSILQPAIAYYLKQGTPDERFQTLYYQGCIYENRGEDKDALINYLKACDIQNVKDSIMLARNMVAQANLLGSLFDFEKYYDLNLRAARLYGSRDRKRSQLNAYTHAFNAAIVLKDRQAADSVRSRILSLLAQYPDFDTDSAHISLSYALTFENQDSIRQWLTRATNTFDSPYAHMIEADAQYFLGNDKEVLDCLQKVDTSSIDANLKYRYLILAAQTNARMNNYKEMAEYYRAYLLKSETEEKRIRGNGLTLAETVFTYEKEKMEEVRARDRVIIIVLSVAVAVLALALIWVLCLRRQKNRLRSDQALLTREFERINQKYNAALTECKVIAGKYDELGNRYHTLSHKHVALSSLCEEKTKQVEQLNHALEDTKRSLREAIRERDKLSEQCTKCGRQLQEAEKELEEQRKRLAEVITVGREHLDMLHAILKKEIMVYTSSSQKEFPNRDPEDPLYEVSKMIRGNNLKAFFAFNRRGFDVLYGEFIEKMNKEGLNESEIDRAILYAIGLKGNQIEAFTKDSRLYHRSSTIRAKFEALGRSSSLGVFLRNLFLGSK